MYITVSVRNALSDVRLTFDGLRSTIDQESAAALYIANWKTGEKETVNDEAIIH